MPKRFGSSCDVAWNAYGWYSVTVGFKEQGTGFPQSTEKC